MSTPTEVALAFEWQGVHLAGSLHLPAGEGPHPLVVMAQGSGPAERDSGGFFDPIRQTFIDRGLATFAFDKPGCGESTGDWHDYGLDARSAQLATALEVVGGHWSIDAGSMGLWGHSQGGWLVQKLAGKGTPLAFAVANSAPSISVGEQVRYESDQALRNAGHNESERAQARTLSDRLHEAAVRGADFSWVLSELLEPTRTKPWYRSFPAITDARDWQHTRLLLNEVHDPLVDLGGVRCPFLAVYGGLDVLLPAWQGAEESGGALARSASADTTVVVFPDGNHRLQHGDDNAFVRGYLDLLGSWVAARTT